MPCFILEDVDETRRFVELLELHQEEGQHPRILQLIARNEYANGQLCRSCVIVDRTVVHNKVSLLRQLQKYEILAQAGFYQDDAGETIQPQWMAPYITLFALNEDDALDALTGWVTDQRRQQRHAFLARNKEAPSTNPSSAPALSRLDRRWISLLHKSPCSQFSGWLKLDVDTKDPEKIRLLQGALSQCTVLLAIETRGGYHVVVETGKSTQELYHFVHRNGAGNEEWVTLENKGKGPMLAMPGTKQGGFVVRLVTEEWQDSVKLRTTGTVIPAIPSKPPAHRLS